jgi:glucokinase
VLNDFAAVALAVPTLTSAEFEQVGPGTPVPHAPVGVIGPGTGLGVCSFIPTPAPGLALPGEGGHVTYGPQTAREHIIVERLKARYSHISAERVVSGPGLVALYEAIVSLNAGPITSLSPSQITAKALVNEDRAAVEVLFVAISL